MKMQKLNLVINGFDSPEGARAIEQTLQNFPLGYCHTFCPRNCLPKLNTDEHVWHPLHAFREIDWSTIRPLDESLIENMRSCEPVMMEIMTRHERKGTVRSYEERKRWYLMHLRYWNHILEEKNIDLFLCYHVPHHCRTYALYALCKLKNIPVLFCNQGPFRGTLLFAEDWEMPSMDLPGRYKELHDRLAHTNEPVTLSPRFEEFFESHVSKKFDPTPWYALEREPTALRIWLDDVLSVLKTHPLLFLRKGIHCALRPLTSAYWERRTLQREGRELFRLYDDHAMEPDFSEKYIYVPLQLQPEASSCPLGGDYCNQLLIVQLLSACLPEDVRLYVKEYPKQTRFNRDIQFYKDLLAVRNVRLMHRATSTFRLIENAVAVATGTGTAGLEALFRGKCTLMFGHDYYQHAPGVFQIRSRGDCEQALKAILEDNMSPRLRDVRIFMKALEEVSFPGHLGKRFQILSEEENASLIGSKFAERLRQYFP